MKVSRSSHRGRTRDHGEIRRRILDAAEECLLEHGYEARLHALIAKKAGLSRPTVYKHVGDQAAIIEALFHREFLRFGEMLEPVFAAAKNPRTGFIDAIVRIVQHGRHHPLLQKGLKENPEQVLPYLTVKARPFIDQTTILLAPYFRQLLTEEQLASINVKAAAEWSFRIAASLLVTPGVVETQTDEQLGDFIGNLLKVSAITEEISATVLAPDSAAS
ncbi:Putative TetR-family transcriptional regulator [Mycobacteroides abscessus subsp. abscessus]|uniref:TetR-family transcriptional regulator n=8 Tax=Mycobacteroides abscessus TaxID=36809 RepID=B1MJH0_MYCA9|nr:TetR/AcrR family transcriptional regulator [Mycobacteroides abscessus]ETZ88126.1 bacterial regulatory s, tetR family protein [Mycobacteroides abscessus MAB_030201_1075]ETZ94097.1 bacterial regulatory s, tetR family protein [Mycobacteroides abscessus MAB_030201_1061]EUA45798.1 bacterial regulatory s, tetR family protein [Mycobacteroides abscessus 21]AKP57252.1 TetR family transcriptional regulator [Mycobacteroides abscessus UC22]ALM15622.1 TetR family transcriptional regulator [Mycobacteroid